MAGDTDMASGLATAVAATAEGGEAPEQPALQLPLLPADQVDGLPTDRAERQQALQAPRRGPGRPAGAINKRTTDWARYLLGKYRSPLEVLAEAYSRPAADLAAELGCSKADAFKVQVHAAAELAPYLHGKMPVEVKMSGDLPVLILTDPRQFLAGLPGAVVDGDAIDLSQVRVIDESEENQSVSDADAAAVGQPELDNEQKAQDDQEVSQSEPLISDQQDGDA